MENRPHALATGLFVLCFAAFLGWAAFWMQGSQAKTKSYLLISESPVSGLSPQATVYYRGLEVGHVEELHFDVHAPRRIEIGISIREDTPITSSTFAKLGYQGLTGIAHIQLDDEGKKFVSTTPSTEKITRIPVRPSLIDTFGDSAPQMLVHASEIMKRASAMMSEENQKNFSQTLSHLETISGNIVRAQAQLQPLLASLPQTAMHLDHTIVESGLAAEQLQGAGQALEQTLLRIQNISQTAETETLPRADKLLDDLLLTSKSARNLLDMLEAHPNAIIFGKPRNKNPTPSENFSSN